eukprot:768412-Hanusia_phi.AAC.5
MGLGKHTEPSDTRNDGRVRSQTSGCRGRAGSPGPLTVRLSPGAPGPRRRRGRGRPSDPESPAHSAVSRRSESQSLGVPGSSRPSQ